MKIAIIGAGISGLTAAYLLSERHEVTVLEAADYPGGHANTATVATKNGPLHIDTGFIVFNDRNYPVFEALLNRLSVASQPTKMSFSVSDGAEFEYSSGSLAGLFAQPRHLYSKKFGRMIADLLRFNREARTLVGAGPNGPSLSEFLEQGGYGREFIDKLIVPQVSAVWSADPDQMWDFPASFMAEFFENHGMFSFINRPKWRTITGGSKEYVKALSANFKDRLFLNSPVTAVSRSNVGVTVTVGGTQQQFDKVIFATHSDQALALLSDATEDERRLLGAIRYEPNEAVLHRDESLLPRRKPARAAWNFHLDPTPAGKTVLTYSMNRLQLLDASDEYCVTLNRTDKIDPEKIISVHQYAHPIYTPAAMTAQEQWQQISGQHHTHFCGAYWRWGFHEDGAFSGLRAAKQIDEDVQL